MVGSTAVAHKWLDLRFYTTGDMAKGHTAASNNMDWEKVHNSTSVLTIKLQHRGANALLVAQTRNCSSY